MRFSPVVRISSWLEDGPERVGWQQIHPVGVGQVPGCLSRGALVAVLPDDPVGPWVDDDEAVAGVVGGEDVAVGQRQRERGLVELGGPGRTVAPQGLACAVEDDDLAGGAVVHREVAAGGDLVGVRGVDDPGRYLTVDYSSPG